MFLFNTVPCLLGSLVTFIRRVSSEFLTESSNDLTSFVPFPASLFSVPSSSLKISICVWSISLIYNAVPIPLPLSLLLNIFTFLFSLSILSSILKLYLENFFWLTFQSNFCIKYILYTGSVLFLHFYSGLTS